ncbi:MAG: lipid-A-disaccharide synthase, partial [Rhodospirillales bacterium 12-54-5]
GSQGSSIFAEVVPHYFAIRARINRMVAFLEAEKPDALITIDSAGFNFRVVNALRKRGNLRPQFIHYVAPTVWAYKPQRAKLIASLYDALLCLLPFEPPYFEAVGLPTHFVGHQIAWEWKIKGDGAGFRARHGIGEITPLLALFPGSRNGELKRMMPIYEGAVAALKRQIPDLELVVQVPSRMVKRLHDATRNWPVKSHILPSTVEKKDVFAAANVALAKSGTIALECALAQLPSVTTYKASTLTAAILRRVLKTKFVNLANILSGSMMIPELLQEDCNPRTLAEALLPLFTDATVRDTQIHGLQNVAAKLGVTEALSPSEKAAAIICGMLG